VCPYDQKFLTNLRKKLTNLVSEEELKTICFDLDVKYNDLPGQGKAGKVRDLIAYFRNRGQITRLIEVILEMRPDIKLDAFGAVDDVSTQVQRVPCDHGAVLNDYYEKMRRELQEGLCEPESGNKMQGYVNELTRTTLSRLGTDGRSKRWVVEFLYGSQLITRGSSIVSLSQVDLHGIDLEGANLSRSNLAEANLAGANLVDADLSQADLARANLRGTDLMKANLCEANLVGADLTEAHLLNAMLQRTNLERAILTNANLLGADLSEADLTECDMTKANLEQANLGRAALSNAKLSRANMRGANLERVDLEGAIEFAGQVKAGTGDVTVDESINLKEGDMYRFEVIGSSMRHIGIHEGDEIIVRVSSEWPSEKDLIVTEYIPCHQPHIIGAEPSWARAGPTVKMYLRKVGDIVELLGWEGDINKLIKARQIYPVGKVVTTHKGREWTIIDVRP
jgi:hypothetical protein